jgi:transposase
MKHIAGIDRNQVILFPEVVDDYISEDNPVRFVDAFVDSLNLKELGFKHAELEDTGRPPYNPADLLKLYIYGYLNRIRSSRMLERECKRNLEVMWLLKKLAPDFKTIADFRKDNNAALKKVFKEFVLLCKKLELFGGELVAIDGSKFKAVNSKKKNFNEPKLVKKLNEIDEKIEKYFKELEENDDDETNISECTDLKAKIEQLKKRKEEYQNLLGRLKESGETQISLTDPDSRAMVNNQRIDVCYNVQTTVDEKHKLIIDYEVTNEVKDSNQLSKMAKRAKEILEAENMNVLTDKGYYDALEIKECVDNGIIPYISKPAPTVSRKINVPEPPFYGDKFVYDRERDVYICPAGHEMSFRNWGKHHGKMMKRYKTDRCRHCEFKTRCTRNKNGRTIYRWEHEEILEEMRERVKNNKDMARKRGELSEHPFGTIKRAFNQGYMLMKRLVKVGGEMALTMLAYNITRVINIVGARTLIARL